MTIPKFSGAFQDFLEDPRELNEPSIATMRIISKSRGPVQAFRK